MESEQYTAEGRCGDAARLLVLIYAGLDVDEALDALRALSVSEACSSEDGVSPRLAEFAEQYSTADAGDFFDRRNWQADFQVGYRTWRYAAELRSLHGSILPDLSDVITAWRCDRPFTDNHEGIWRDIAAEARRMFGEPQPQQAWEQRRVHCTRHAEQQLERLGSATQNGKPANPALIDFYEHQFELYQE